MSLLLAGSGSQVVRAEEIARILAPHSIFARFDREALLAIAAEFCVVCYKSGAELMREGEPGSFAALILEGEADVFVSLPLGLGQTGPGQTGPGQTGPGQTGPGQTGPGQTGPGQTGPGQTGPGQTGPEQTEPVQMATVGPGRVIGELGVFTDMPRSATVIARGDVVAARIEQHSLMRLSAEYPSIAVAIIRELGGRLALMNRSLAYLTYAADALGRDEFDSALLDRLTSLPDALGTFGRAFAGMACEIRAKQTRRAEMRAAAQIQQSILPPPWLPPQASNGIPSGPASRVDLHAEMHPAREVGGDFYDYYLIDPSRLAFTVADVSGKGIPAALFMAVSRTIMRGISAGGDLSAGIADANRLLATQNTACMFVTLFHGVLDLTSGVLRYCNAGHNPPYLLRAGRGRSSLEATGIPLGIEDRIFYRVAETVLAPGDTLFLFSDGITEAFDTAENQFGTARLERILDTARGIGAADLVARILRETAAFTAGAEPSDDITCLALTFRGLPREV